MTIDKSRMKDAKGAYITQALIWELVHNKQYAQFTLENEVKECHGLALQPIRTLYLEMGDLTEYEFATEYFVDWRHWQRCLENKKFLMEVMKWREELALKIQAKGLRSQIDLAVNGGNANASRWLAERGWEPKEGKRGRPSKKEVERETKRQAFLSKEVEDEYSRLGLDSTRLS